MCDKSFQRVYFNAGLKRIEVYHDIVSRLVDSGAECVHSYGQCERFIGYLILRSDRVYELCETIIIASAHCLT